MGKRMTIKELKEMINFMRDDAIVELIDDDMEVGNELEQERIANCRSLLNNIVVIYRKLLVNLSDTLADGCSISINRKHQMITYGHKINRLVSDCFLEYGTTRRSSHIRSLIDEIKINHGMVNDIIDIYRDYADDTRQEMFKTLDGTMSEMIETIETNLL